jgi:hypothetical protein
LQGEDEVWKYRIKQQRRTNVLPAKFWRQLPDILTMAVAA